MTAFPAKQQTGHALVKDWKPWGDTNMACTHFLINYTCWKSFFVLGSYELLQSEGLHYRAVHQYGISWNIFKEIWCKCIYWHKVFNLPVNEILPNPENNPHKEKSPKPLRVSEVSKTRCGLGHKVCFVSMILSACFWNQFKLLLYSYMFLG